VIVERNALTMVQERYNTEWIDNHQFGIVLRSFTDVASGIERMLEAGRLAHFRERVCTLDNRAVFEIPELLDELMAQAPVNSAPRAFDARA
jgi:1,2-diacylglycerol 3-beta-galactosyltransferase